MGLWPGAVFSGGKCKRGAWQAGWSYKQRSKVRARRLALSLLELGEDVEGAERQLHRWRFHPLVAREATAWAWKRHSEANAAANAWTPDDAA